MHSAFPIALRIFLILGGNETEHLEVILSPFPPSKQQSILCRNLNTPMALLLSLQWLSQAHIRVFNIQTTFSSQAFQEPQHSLKCLVQACPWKFNHLPSELNNRLNFLYLQSILLSNILRGRESVRVKHMNLIIGHCLGTAKWSFSFKLQVVTLEGGKAVFCFHIPESPIHLQNFGTLMFSLCFVYSEVDLRETSLSVTIF